jgi:hypothetical protein
VLGLAGLGDAVDHRSVWSVRWLLLGPLPASTTAPFRVHSLPAHSSLTQNRGTLGRALLPRKVTKDTHRWPHNGCVNYRNVESTTTGR